MEKDKVTVAVIGAGKMGLPLACRIASQGAQVIACDVNQSICDTINKGQCPFEEPGLDKVLAQVVASGHLKATTKTSEAVKQSNVIIVIVPVLLTEENEADTSIIEAVTRDIAGGLQKGAMVSYETTLPAGSTRSFVPLLEASGLKAGEDFDLVFSPERVKSQLVLERLAENPKVVGGINARSAARAEEFYHRFLGAPVINVGSLEASEFVKLAGMVYRDVNIALANELARYASAIGCDINQIIAAANTDGEAAILTPGIGVGGHCTPVYPYFLINDSNRRGIRQDLAAVSRNINDRQPGYMLDQIEQQWGSLHDQDVLILGLAFRPQVKESICSPAFQLRDGLKERGARVYLQDPLYDNEELERFGFSIWRQGDTVPPVVILNTAHHEFRGLKLSELSARGCQVFLDGRNMLSAESGSPKALIYIGIGIGRGNDITAVSAKGAAKRIPIVKPQLDTSEAQAAAETIHSGWIMQGPRVAQLEQRFADYVGAAHACAVSSGTAALHLALLACGVGPGDEVITVSHSFIATANSVRLCGATPVFVDIDAGTYNIDASRVEAAITDKTRAILCVHQMGMPCDLRQITQLAAKHSPRLAVIEDAACAIGSEILWEANWQRIGRPHADMACFSFHPRKLLTTGDGGMITTHDASLDDACRLLRNHGMRGSQFDRVGFNYRLTDIQAAIGIRQLERLQSMIPKRRHQAELYMSLLAGIPSVQLPQEPQWARSNWQSFCILFATSDDRRQAAQALDERGIDTRPGVMCAHREPAYKGDIWRCGTKNSSDSKGHAAQILAQSERAQDCGLILPLFDELTAEQMHQICDTIRTATAVASRS